MSDAPENPPQPTEEASVEQENKLTSDRFDEFREALEILYVIANLSGRNQFSKAWPEVAEYIFGEELMRYDYEGTSDKERRAELEIQAEERRLALLEFMDALEDNSVKEGALQIDYVRGEIEKYGRDLSLLIYGRQIVDRFIEPPPEPAEPEEAVQEDEQPAEPEPVYTPPPVLTPGQPVTPVIEELSPESPDPVGMPADALDDVKPIDMGAPLGDEVPAQQPLPEEGMDSVQPIETPAPPAMPSEPPSQPDPVESLQPPVESPQPPPVQPVHPPVASPPLPEEPAPVTSTPPPQPPQEENTQRPVSMMFVPSENPESPEKSQDETKLSLADDDDDGDTQG